MKITAPIRPVAPRYADDDQITLPRVVWILLAPFILLLTIVTTGDLLLALAPYRFRTKEAKLWGEQLRDIESQENVLETTGILRSQTMIRSGYYGVLNLVQLGNYTIEFLGPYPQDKLQPENGEGLRVYRLQTLRSAVEGGRGTRYMLGGSVFTFEFTDGSSERCEILHTTEWRNALASHPLIGGKFQTRY